MSTEGDALDLTYWHESKPDKGTFFTDEQVAASLQWWRKDVVAAAYDKRTARYKGGGPVGDAARVRKARNYVNRHTKNTESPFIGYSFGTKRNGAGQKWTMLIVREHAPPTLRALQDATAEQFGRIIQQQDHIASEREVQITRLNELEAQYMALGQIERALWCHDAALELHLMGRLSMETVRRGQTLGLVGASGGIL